MNKTTSILVTLSIVISMVSTLFILLSNVLSIAPIWVLWEISIVSTLLAIIIALSSISASLFQWLREQHKNKFTTRTHLSWQV